MRHYEVVLLVHPDQSEQVPSMIERMLTSLKEKQTVVHRHEDWGRRPLAYPIKKLHKAHYVLLNIECTPAVRTELENSLRYNDAIIRYLILSRPVAISDMSAMMKSKESRSERRYDDEYREADSETVAAEMV